MILFTSIPRAKIGKGNQCFPHCFGPNRILFNDAICLMHEYYITPVFINITVISIGHFKLYLANDNMIFKSISYNLYRHHSPASQTPTGMKQHWLIHSSKYQQLHSNGTKRQTKKHNIANKIFTTINTGVCSMQMSSVTTNESISFVGNVPKIETRISGQHSDH